MEAGQIPDPARGVYGISVAAELSGVGVQSLRLYETRGLLEPARSAGGTRRYSDNDVQRLRHIAELLSGGLNLAGVAAVLELEAINQALRRQIAERRGTNMLQVRHTGYRSPTPAPRPDPS